MKQNTSMKWSALEDVESIPDSCRVKGAGYIGSFSLVSQDVLRRAYSRFNDPLMEKPDS